MSPSPDVAPNLAETPTSSNHSIPGKLKLMCRQLSST
jgi:hypothetical protein